MTDTEYLLDTSQVLVVGSTVWIDTFTEALDTRTEASIQTVETTTEALDIVRQDSIDCLVTEYALDETTGVELVRRLRELTLTLPIVLGTRAGSEAIASEAIEAGVTDYVALTEPDDQTIDESDLVCGEFSIPRPYKFTAFFDNSGGAPLLTRCFQPIVLSRPNAWAFAD